MTTSAPPRPRQVTFAGWMIIIGSLLVVVTVVEVISGLRSLETREAVEAFLAEPPGNGLGIGVETVLQVLHVSAMVTAGCATAAAVLGWHALQRNRGARIGLTVLAVPLFFAGVVTGGFLSSMVAAASLLLWLQPARDWFDGKEPRPAPEPAHHAATPTDQGVGPGAGEPPAPAEPRAVQGFGDRPTWEHGAALPPHGDRAAAPVPAPTRRPDAVVVAAITTWVFAGFALLSTVVSMAVLASEPDTLLDEIRRQNPEVFEQGVTESLLVSTTFVVGVLVVVWSLGAVVSAAMVLARRPWAGLALQVFAGLTALLCFVGAFVTFALALPALAGVAVFGLMRRPDVRAWLAAAPARSGRPPVSS